MSLIRQNRDLKYVIIHHTGQYATMSGLDINKIFNKNGFFGVPYDIIINQNGNIDLSPRWIHGLTSDQYELNIRIPNIIQKYKIHHYAGLDLLKYNQEGIHIALVGNFDINNPTPLQYTALSNVLKEISLRLDLDMVTALLYYSEIFSTTSPGSLFFNKTKFFN